MCGLSQSKLINANTMMWNSNSITDTLLPALSRVQHALFFCEEDVQWFFTLFLFFLVYQNEAHPIQVSRRIHVIEWVSASEFAIANSSPGRTTETMPVYKLWVCTLILVKCKSL